MRRFSAIDHEQLSVTVTCITAHKLVYWYTSSEEGLPCKGLPRERCWGPIYLNFAASAWTQYLGASHRSGRSPSRETSSQACAILSNPFACIGSRVKPHRPIRPAKSKTRDATKVLMKTPVPKTPPSQSLILAESVQNGKSQVPNPWWDSDTTTKTAIWQE